MNPTTKVIEIPCLADPHVHLRQGDVVAALLEYSVTGGADYVGAMPNTTPGLTTAEAVLEYEKNARRLLPAKSVGTLGIIKFLMLTESTTVGEIEKAAAAGIKNAKLYPLNRTTNSSEGIRNYFWMTELIEKCGEVGIMCHVHPEHPLLDISGRDAEYLFISYVDLFLEHTKATIVWEHGTDARCVPIWEKWAKQFPNRFYVTLTAHHLIFDDDMDHGDVTAVCKPPIMSKLDRHVLLDLIRKGYPWVMLGSDSAFHPSGRKNVDKGCCACGAFVAPFLAPLCAHALDDIISGPYGIGIFENFVSNNARRLHNLPSATRRIRLVREEWEVPLTYDVAGEQAFPFMRGQKLRWGFAEKPALHE